MQSPEEEQLPETAVGAHTLPPAGNASLGWRGSDEFSRVMTKPVCTQPLGKHRGEQQHLVLVPEESSDRVAWRTLCRGPDTGSWTPKVRSAPTPRRTNDNCEGVRSSRNSSSSGRPVPRSPWEQKGSDLLPGGRGIAASPASSLDSVLAGFGEKKWLVIFSELNAPPRKVACSKAFLKKEIWGS